MECGRYLSYLSGLNFWPLHRSSLFSSLYWFCRFIKCKYFLDRDSEIVGHETCQRTVPEAIIAFLESKDFEDAIRNAVSLGGDTDTLGAITGSIAETFYGIPAVLLAECRSRIDEGLMTDILDEFGHALGRDKMIEAAIDQYYVQQEMFRWQRRW